MFVSEPARLEDLSWGHLCFPASYFWNDSVIDSLGKCPKAPRVLAACLYPSSLQWFQTLSKPVSDRVITACMQSFVGRALVALP